MVVGRYAKGQKVMTDLYPTDREIRNCAVLLLAADLALCDGFSVQSSLDMAEGVFNSVDSDLIWAGGRHEGDCTNQPHTCSRCLIEDMEDKARKMWDE